LPYVSKSERATASRMTWTEILAHVREAEQCDEREARRKIGKAIANRKLGVRWADERHVWGMSGPMQPPPDEPPRDAAYWLECKADAGNLDHVLEQLYDPSLVDRRTAARLDRKRHFRKPIFLREQVLLLWPHRGDSATARDEAEARRFLKALLKADRSLTFKAALNACREMCPQLSERGFRARVWPRAREAAGLPRQQVDLVPPAGNPRAKPLR
jgi:hypothetical protein